MKKKYVVFSTIPFLITSCCTLNMIQTQTDTHGVSDDVADVTPTTKTISKPTTSVQVPLSQGMPMRANRN
jgi:hypothetical protein